MTEIEKPKDDYHFKPAQGWTCFHCGETFTVLGLARDHFGLEPSSDPGCRIKVGAERGLLMALRKAELDIERMSNLLRDQSCEAYKLYAAQASRHQDQILDAEELGYQRGLADAQYSKEKIPWLDSRKTKEDEMDRK